MGYRSEVKSVIYGKPSQMEKLKKIFSDEYNQLCADFTPELDGDNHVCTNLTYFEQSELGFIYLNLEYAKWYECFSDVKHWDEFLKLAQQLELSTEFVRIGEEDNDIETMYFGEDCKYFISPVSSIYVTFN